jgi:hypothetical protein
MLADLFGGAIERGGPGPRRAANERRREPKMAAAAEYDLSGADQGAGGCA